MPPDDGAPRFLEPLLGVVFDLDGTLVLSGHDFPKMRREVVRVAERHGVVPGHLSPAEPVPRLMEAAIAELEAANVPEGARFRFEAEVNARIDAIELEALPRTVARRGAKALLASLTQRGFRLAVLTRSSRQFCYAALERTELLPYFPFLRTRSSPGPVKPSPEALLALLGEMGVPRERALYVGDHLLDAECATRARVRFYGVLDDAPGPESLTAERFRAVGASAIAKDLDELGRHLGDRVASAPGAAPPG